MISTSAMTALREIRAAIADGRWTQGASTDGLGNYCLSGWVERTAGEGVEPEVTMLLHNHAKTKGFMGIISFNDARRRTKEEVVDFIDEVLAGRN